MSRSRRPLLLALTALIIGAVLLIGAAITLLTRVGQPPIPNLAPPIDLESLAGQYPQLAALLNDPKMGSLLKQFVVEYERGGVDGAKAFARTRGFMNDNGDLTLTLLTDTGDVIVLNNLKRELTALGAEVLGQRKAQSDGVELFVVVPWSAVEAQIRAGRTVDQLLSSISQLGHIRGVLPQDPVAPRQSGPATRAGNPNYDSVGEGVQVTNAHAWHSAGFTGAGVKVGILDPEVSLAGQYIQSGVLPADTQVFTEGCVSSGGRVDDEGVHGVAAAEIVHEMAPDAQLFIACDLSDAGLDWLLSNDVRIISHSAGGFRGPRDGSGVYEQQVNQLARRGILWVNSAGNSGQTVHRGQLTGASSAYTHDFAPGQKAMALRAGSDVIQVVLNWNEWNTTTVSDYDLYLYDETGRLVEQSVNDSTAMRHPFERLIAPTTPGALYYVVVKGDRATRAASFLIECHNAKAIEYATTGGSIASPALAAGSLTVGAVPWNAESIAPYSSRGPSDDGRIKPDIAAPTDVSSDVYGSEFPGTSSSAPHVAGAAALVWGRSPDLSRDDVVQFLLQQTKDLGDPGADNEFGAGLLRLSAPAPVQPANTPAPLPTVAPNPTQPSAPTPALPTPTAIPASVAAPTLAQPATQVQAPTPSPTPGFWDQIGQAGSTSLETVAILVGIGGVGGVLFMGGLVTVFAWLRRNKSAPALAMAGSGQPASPAHMPTKRASSPPPPSPPQTKPNAARFCTQCGAPLTTRAKFCTRCGQRVN